MYRSKFGRHNPDETYVKHKFNEHIYNTGEIQLNYAKVGSSNLPAILCIPSQTESWWGYEKAMELLQDKYEVFAIDLRGQGRSSRTPGRYTIDNFGHDCILFIQNVIKRPCVVSGLSSGGVTTAWLSAYAPPGMIIAAHYEDPPLFAAELTPKYGQGIRQGAGPIFKLYNQYLGDQWSVGNFKGLCDAAPSLMKNAIKTGKIPQNLKEYDPEWGKMFYNGTACSGCNHATMLSKVKVPVLFSHHSRREVEGRLLGAISDFQVKMVEKLIKGNHQLFEYHSFPDMPHNFHRADPETYVNLLHHWIQSLNIPEEQKNVTNRKNHIAKY